MKISYEFGKCGHKSGWIEYNILEHGAAVKLEALADRTCMKCTDGISAPRRGFGPKAQER